jgi:hypothetical protein
MKIIKGQLAEEGKGRGIYYFSNEEKVDGEWDGAILKKRYFPDGSTFVGTFDKKFNRMGHGVYTWPDGKTCEGKWDGERVKGDATLIIPGTLCCKYIGPVNDELAPNGAGKLFTPMESKKWTLAYT